ncbi:YqgE/AlgH family protein [Rhodocyclus tenuis]|uniref:YqgE/AlgH family protein n=1 Tax=Rhodocyclus gracilis TaxID=2929842 RepID=UPI0012989515|nr:YqgE/AlgH family protein [Rhodocyclus gracilis]MRD72195.1 YqgE/AlgH family protein [Rhodocyclus gracilis]
MQSIDLTDHFLIAMPAMGDPYFARALVYIAEHNERGALGLIVNRPTDMSLASLFEKLETPLAVDELAGQPVYFGGPVQTDRGFVLHRPAGHWQSTLVVNERIGLTSSRDILQSAARNGEPKDLIIALGYAGWSAGQLEQELGENAWLTAPANEAVLFDQPSETRLASALEILGIDFTRLTGAAGHA